MQIYGVWYADECDTDFYLHREKAVADAWDYLCDTVPEMLHDKDKMFNEFAKTGVFEYGDSTLVAIDPYIVDEKEC